MINFQEGETILYTRNIRRVETKTTRYIATMHCPICKDEISDWSDASEYEAHDKIMNYYLNNHVCSLIERRPKYTKGIDKGRRAGL
jgi:hypothetical protein